MLGSSRASFAEAREALAARAGEAGFAEVGGDLLAVSTVLASSSMLRGTLADTGRAAEERAALVRAVLAGKVGELAVDIVADTVRRRWAQGRDLVDAVEALGVEAKLIVSEQAGRIDAVEDELFRIDRMVAGDAGLRQALSDPAVSGEAKANLLGSLLDGRVAAETAALVRHVVTHPRGRRLERALADLVEASARRRERVLAKVRVAAPISDDQQNRLAAVLSHVYGRTVDLQVEVDPEVLGGVVVTVGDEVIDGSVAHKLEEIRRRMGVN
jgi:F-type H+-transporting ATPase subunit delta